MAYILIGKTYANGVHRRAVESINAQGVVCYRIGRTSKLRYCSLKTFAAWAKAVV